MADPDTLRKRLATLSQVELATLLERRPDVLAGAIPRDLGELAHRLWHRYSLVETISTLSTPHLQLLEAASSLGDGCAVAAVADLLSGEGAEHRWAVQLILRELVDLAIMTERDDVRLALPVALAELMPDPLQLGQPLAVLVPALTADRLRSVLTKLGVPKTAKRAGLESALIDFYADRDNVLTVLASAPANVVDYLAEQVGSPADGDDFDDDADDVFDRYDGRPYAAFARSRGVFSNDSTAYRQRLEAEQWAVDRALAVPSHNGWGVDVPAEVARALRGRDYHAPFVPVPPEATTRPADPKHIEQASAAAASALFGQLLTVLDHVARHPVASVKSGGIGARELVKLAKTCGVDEATIRLTLECADELGLVARGVAAVGMTPEFVDWRALEPGEQLAGVIRAWWAMGANPTESRDEDGKTLRVLSRPRRCAGCSGARVALLEVLAELPADAAVERRDIAPRAIWRHPFVHVADADADDPLATPWREAEALGVLAVGSLTAIGRALRNDGTDEGAQEPVDPLLAATRAALPAVADQATFGSDLTAYAVGAPSARVTAILDAAADRESSGGAVTWRFSPSSVRRAFDDGGAADALLAELTHIAGGDLPQPLRYLIADVARRHGNLRLSAATTCVCSDDEALLAEVAADRKLAKLGLRLLAPTVLAADVALDTLLGSLRSAGYLPVVDNVGSVIANAPPTEPDALSVRGLIDTNPYATRAAGPPPTRLVPDPVAVASSLLERSTTVLTAVADERAGTPTEADLRKLRLKLSGAELHQLADAIDNRGRVMIEYRSQSGSYTQRVISGLALVGPSLYAWCELRQEDRYFTLSRILSVAAV